VAKRSPEDRDRLGRPLPVWGRVGQHIARTRFGRKKEDRRQGRRTADGVPPRTSRQRSHAAADERHTYRHFSVAALCHVHGT
jgi:hypothetical protein